MESSIPPTSPSPSVTTFYCKLHPSLPIPPLASTQCPPPLASTDSLSPPPLSANPSTDLHSVSSTPLCQSLH
ncbi:unnamed protein product [Staurois parvus]|uniref:Uncharacterized protein n=1 Tax=Staurois parvus TaxID=386267 RepID=A0ABN9B2X0_9NEOB|nr:unnamed protein product [Staurois parvus]